MRWLFWLLCAGCTTEPVDVIIIGVDTLRVDHVSAYGADSPAKTPHMDALAADGVRHTQAFSPISVTAPAFASVMTGQAPSQHGVLMNVFRGGAPLGEEAQTLAERFGAAEARYATGAFVSAYTLRREVGLAQGFDLYNGGERANRWGHKTFTQALSWLASHRERHIFLWVHSYDAHGPVRRYAKLKDTHRPWDNSPTNAARLPKYQADPQISDPAYYREMYARGVEFSDEQVGRLVQALKEQDRYEDAMIILLADHGESLTERELWFDHGTSAHVEQLQVPLIVKYPGGKRAGSVDDRLVSLVDVAPTVLSVAGLPALPDPAGLPLTQAGVLHTELTGESSHCKEVAGLPCWPRGGLGKELAVRSLAETTVYKQRQSGPLVEHYSRSGDPAEAQPETVVEIPAALQGLVADRQGRAYADPPGAGAVETEEVQKLRQLGYVE
jgi:arylsulfatase